MEPEAMACAIMGFVILGGAIGLSLMAASFASRSSRLNQGFRVASSTLKGHFVPGGVWRRPTVSMRHGDTAGRLRIEKTSGVECTEFSLNWPSMPAKFEIVSRSQPFKYRRNGWMEQPIDHGRLDRVLRMRCSVDSEMPKHLSEGVKWQLQRLNAFLPLRDVYIGCLRRQLIVRKWGVVKDSYELIQFVRLALELYDQFQLTQVVGIDFVDEIEATLLEDVDCPICGEPIVTGLVSCTSCKTPHHKDCWDYNGRCATFACGQERYSLPAVARPIDAQPTEKKDAEQSPDATPETKAKLDDDDAQSEENKTEAWTPSTSDSTEPS